MSTNGDTTFKSGSINSRGRPPGSRTQVFLEMQRIGEENSISNYKRLQLLADEGNKDVLMFLHNKVVPDAKGSRISLPLKAMNTLEDVKHNETIIMLAVADSMITLEQGEKLYVMTDQNRKTIESTEIAKTIEEMQQRMKDAGL